jgi:hypothetical protein
MRRQGFGVPAGALFYPVLTPKELAHAPCRQRATTVEQRGPELQRQAQRSAPASAFGDGDAPVYTSTPSGESMTERPGQRLRRDR